MYPIKRTLRLSTGQSVGTGWLPSTPDMRDYTTANAKVKSISKKLHLKPGKELPTTVDLRKWCSPVENQGELGSCTAHAGMGIIEYYEKRAFNKRLDGSRLFLYKATRNLMQVTGDEGAFIRCTIGALALCGVPAEKYWPYKIENFDVDPPAFVYAIADNYEALTYFRHDTAGRVQGAGSRGLRTGSNRQVAANKLPALSSLPLAPASEEVLASVKKYLEAGIPAMFGFWGFGSYADSDVKGGIPYPCENEPAEWGHAVVAVGYDDKLTIKNLSCGKETTGALLIRNSWGKEWGDNGYGWLPYDYVRNGLASDFWSLLSMEWMDTGQFGF